jgi:hypothetical protein
MPGIPGNEAFLVKARMNLQFTAKYAGTIREAFPTHRLGCYLCSDYTTDGSAVQVIY